MTVVVCTRDRTDSLRECLHSLRQVSYSPLEILVVDNAPAGDATRRLVAALAGEDPRIRYACEPRPGLSSARNRGLAQAGFDIVAFTDDDVLTDPGWVPACAAGFAADPDTGCVTGPVACRSLDTGPEQYYNARDPLDEGMEPRRYDLAAHRVPSALYPWNAAEFGWGANFAVRRGAAARIGGFDPLLGAGAPGRGGEEIDFFARLVLAGGRISYLPSALVWHRPYPDLRSLSRQMYCYGHGLGAYVAKHLPDRNFRSALIRHGLRSAAALAGQQLQASAVSRLGIAGRRLALTEARGALAGALRYHRAARRGQALARGAAGPHAGAGD